MAAPRSGPAASPAARATRSIRSPCTPRTRRSGATDTCRVTATTRTTDSRVSIIPSPIGVITAPSHSRTVTKVRRWVSTKGSTSRSRVSPPPASSRAPHRADRDRRRVTAPVGAAGGERAPRIAASVPRRCSCRSRGDCPRPAPRATPRMPSGRSRTPTRKSGSVRSWMTACDDVTCWTRPDQAAGAADHGHVDLDPVAGALVDLDAVGEVRDRDRPPPGRWCARCSPTHSMSCSARRPASSSAAAASATPAPSSSSIRARRRSFSFLDVVVLRDAVPPVAERAGDGVGDPPQRARRSCRRRREHPRRRRCHGSRG